MLGVCATKLSCTGFGIPLVEHFCQEWSEFSGSVCLPGISGKCHGDRARNRHFFSTVSRSDFMPSIRVRSSNKNPAPLERTGLKKKKKLTPTFYLRVGGIMIPARFRQITTKSRGPRFRLRIGFRPFPDPADKKIERIFWSGIQMTLKSP